jgi:DNA (cytosine-5)-methyltransferase 1
MSSTSLAASGGFSLGLERAGMRTVQFCEIDPFCRSILAKHWPGVPCHGDIRTLEVGGLGGIDLVCGGFPCQDISLAGNRAGTTGERSGLYRQMLRAIRLVRPRFAILENVAALLGLGMGDVLADVAEDGYDAEWDCISASDVGAPHGRDRIWITLTDPHQFERSQRSVAGFGWWNWRESEIEETRNADGAWQLQPPRLLGDIRRRVDNATSEGTSWTRDWQTEFEALRGMDDGLPDGLDKSEASAAVKALGNTLVPQIPEIIGRAIMTARAKAGVKNA